MMANVESMRRVVLAVLTLFALLASPVIAERGARADEIAPELETLELRQKAQAEAKRLVSSLAAGDQRRLVGLYLAFDTNASDPSAMVACDDDGDYVIVVTDALLRLISLVARAQSYDEANASHALEDYAGFVARSQIPSRRLLPPPPGFFTAQQPGTTQESRLREALSFVVARELAHLRAGDLVCAHPTATHEHGDDEWTAAEQRRAIETAARVYPGHALERDTEATARVLDAGRAEEGALGLLRFFAQFEVERAVAASRFAPTYLVQHPGAAIRMTVVRTAARDHRTP